jgi:DNA-binding NarL/FixJ family response regulator
MFWWLPRTVGTPGRPGSNAAGPSQSDVAGLTPRELDVLTLIGKGFSNTETADELCISGVTVKAASAGSSGN